MSIAGPRDRIAKVDLYDMFATSDSRPFSPRYVAWPTDLL